MSKGWDEREREVLARFLLINSWNRGDHHYLIKETAFGDRALVALRAIPKHGYKDKGSIA